MSIRKRTWTSEDGTTGSAYVVDLRDQNGKRLNRNFRTKKEAVAWETQKRAEIQAGTHVADSASVTVEAAAKDWIKSGRERDDPPLESSTLDQRDEHVRLHIAPFIGKLKLTRLTGPRVRAFESELREAGRSAVMVRKVMTSLGGILADALERGTVGRNVVRELRARRGKGTAKRHENSIEAGVDIPEPAEVKAIVAALEGHYRPVILAALFTGLRASELRGLDWRNVDLDAGELHVRERADKNNTIGSPKTAASRRTVQLSPIVLNALKARKLETGGKGLVFGTRTGRPDYIQNIVKRGWWPAQIAAGVTVPVLDKDRKPVLDEKGQPVLAAKYSGLHSARHWYASWLINPQDAGGLGLAPKAVQTRMGHSSITVTFDVYGHLFPAGNESAKLAAAEAALLG